MMPCGLALSPPLLRRPLTTVTYSRCGSSGLRMNGKSKSRPVLVGVHSSCSAPCGKYTKPRRGCGAAAVCAHAVPAGIMASSSGSAMVAPAPLRTVRRDRCFLNRNISKLLLKGRPEGRPLPHPGNPGYSSRRRFRDRPVRVVGFPLSERVARNHAKDDGLEAVVVRGRLANDAANRGHVAVIKAPAQRVRHQVFRERLHELMIGPLDQLAAQVIRAADLRAVRQLTRGIDETERVGVVAAILPHRVEVLQRQAERIHDAVAREACRLLAMLLEPRPQRTRRLA